MAVNQTNPISEHNSKYDNSKLTAFRLHLNFSLIQFRNGARTEWKQTEFKLKLAE